MKRVIELAALAIVIVALSGLVTHMKVEHELNSFVKGIFHKFIPWINLDFNV